MQPAVITQLKLIQNHGAETNGPIRFRLTGKNGVAKTRTVFNERKLTQRNLDEIDSPLKYKYVQ